MGRLQAAFFGLVIVGTVAFFITRPTSEEQYARAQTSARDTHASIIFGGDIMFDRSIREVVAEKGGDYIFSCIDGVLKNVDLAVANLEGPITDHPSKSIASTVGGEFNYTFTFPTSTAPLLFAHNIQAVSIGNNHVMNFGREGLSQTKMWLEKAGVRYFGDLSSVSMIYHRELSRIPLSFVNYNEFGGSASTTVDNIKRERAAGYLPIVYAHWGEEYATTSSADMRALAHSFIDADAEIVIGSHPHVVEEHEMYKGKNIYYSLGNFIFDQYWNEDVRTGLLLEVAFDRNGVVSVKEIPIHLERNRRTCPL